MIQLIIIHLCATRHVFHFDLITKNDMFEATSLYSWTVFSKLYFVSAIVHQVCP